MFTVSISAASGLPATVDWATADGTATAGSDYTATSGSLVFAAGTTSQTVSVPVSGDTLHEADETFAVDALRARERHARRREGRAAPSRTTTPPPPSRSPTSAVTEGNSGTTNAVFTVSLSAASGLPASVDWATADGTATAGSDYAAASGSLAFAAGETTKTVTVAVTGDAAAEADETFAVNLSGAGGATIADAQGAGTIRNDDVAPGMSINDVTLVEGNSGTSNAVFTVSLSAAYPLAVSVNWATANGGAISGSDFASSSGALVFAAGTTSQTVSVPVSGDTLYEADEAFAVNLSGAGGATITDAQGLGTIRNDDAMPTLSINDVSVTEGNSGTTNAVFTVSLSAASGLPASVSYATTSGTATAGSDYAAASGNLAFAAGETTKTVTVAVMGDAVYEADETLAVNLSGASGATIADAQGVGTIRNDDAMPTLSVSDVTLTEGNSGTTNAVFTVSISAASSLAVTVNYATANGTATAGSDYTARTGSLTFAAGVTNRTISVPVTGDVRDEADETFVVNLSSPVNATIADGQGLGTIIDNDATPTVSINSVSRNEGRSGTTTFTFTVNLSAASGRTVTVAWATSNGTAIAGSDYTAASGTLTFSAGTTSRSISVRVTGDTVRESNETFYVNLSNPTNATVATSPGVGTIVNDD